MRFSKGPVTVEWKTVGMTATAGKDFKEDIGTVALQDKQKYERIRVEIINNEIGELMKSFQVVLNNPTGGGNFTDRMNLFHFHSYYFILKLQVELDSID